MPPQIFSSTVPFGRPFYAVAGVTGLLSLIFLGAAAKSDDKATFFALAFVTL